MTALIIGAGGGGKGGGGSARVAQEAPDSLRSKAGASLQIGGIQRDFDISDQLDVEVSSPGGGLFVGSFFVEGIHEENKPLNDEMDDVTVRFDLSPAEYFATNPFPTS